MNRAHLDELIRLAIAEDVGSGDVTSAFFVPVNRRIRATVVAKEAGVFGGVEVAERVFKTFDSEIRTDVMLHDGSKVAPGAMALKLEGGARSILSAERVALNFLQRLSGIATLTHRYVEAVRGTGVEILDTRKTTPGWREIEKAAVRAGGGTNHRMGLYDRAMVKDNHLLADADGEAIPRGIHRLKEEHPGMLVELEADTLEQVERFLAMGQVDIILLDNMTLEQMREAVRMRGPKGPRLEASGGVNLETVREIAETGVDQISVGALTHSARALDLSLEFLPLESQL